MTQKEIMEFALKGIMADIRELENKIYRGYQVIEKKKDKPNSVKKEFSEIRDIIKGLEADKEDLSKKYDALQWDICMAEGN